MATSSIMKNFIIDSDQVETFVNALEASADDKTPRVPVNYHMINSEAELVELMKRREKARAGK